MYRGYLATKSHAGRISIETIHTRDEVARKATGGVEGSEKLLSNGRGSDGCPTSR